MFIILMYHAVVKDTQPGLAGVEDPRYCITQGTFVEQMNYLKARNIPVCKLDALFSDTDVHTRRVILTFDDGLKSHYEIVRPILEKRGFIGHFFINVENVGQPGYMSWDELINLRRDGHVIGSHGLSHRILTMLSGEEIVKELTESRSIISQRLKGPVDYFSVPGGFYNSWLKEVAREIGYIAVLTSNMGINRIPLSFFKLKRIAIRPDMPLEKLRLIIEKGQIPYSDKLAYFSKRMLQKVIGDKRYHKLRNQVSYH